MSIDSLSYIICAAAYAALVGLFLINRRWLWPDALFSVAALGTSVWAVIWTTFPPQYSPDAHLVRAAGEALRFAGWAAVLVVLIAVHRSGDKSPWPLLAGRWLGGLSVILAGLIGLQLAAGFLAGATSPDTQAIGADLLSTSRLVMAVAGLVLIENLYRNAHPDERWSLKFLVLGLAGIFGFDVILFSDAVLYRGRASDLEAARGIINALVVPLIALSAARSPAWAPRVHVSRSIVFHSATLLGSGTYLLLVAAAGFYVREIGGTWGGVAQTALVFAGILLLLAIIVSGRFRAALKRFVSAHFYTYKYDYRHEWLRFMSRLSDEGKLPLGERVVRAVADVFEIPEGQLWLRQDGAFVLHTAWNLPPTRTPEEEDSDFSLRLAEGDALLVDARAEERTTDDVPLPAWLAALPRAWLAVPLIHRNQMIGFLILGRSRHPRSLAGEDKELLGILARQAASYMGEWIAFEELTEARRFQEFNKRVTFVTHDLKNLSSQLSLMVGNADRLRDNPDFIDDMIATVRDAVGKLKTLLAQLKADSARESGPPAGVPLGPVIDDILRRHAHDAPVPAFAGMVDGLAVPAGRGRLTAVLRNLVNNAIDAAGPSGCVELRVDRCGETAVIEVADNGPGMDPSFVRSELFRPFRSTKGSGLGIGAYECREFARRAGGSLNVDTAPGRGTTMRLVLPLAPTDGARTEKPGNSP
ncbi:MAG: PEP-CTERM system histidine kinase PrsK [Alphaproteobacteria bacterium]|nr:PEP-CTERM system histidine kinase PrsK [Alphaproteobacteria bacterium]